MYKYWAFGLNIISEIEFPEMLPHEFETPDVSINIGEIPAKIEGDDVTHRVGVSASPDEYMLKVNNIARYYAFKGSNIIIEPIEGADLESIRLFLLSNAMAAIIHQRGTIPFHASGIITDNGLVLFTGRSGIGKSTTALALMQRGYSLFTDDVCVLSYNNHTNNVEAFASYPMMKLWENTIDKMAVEHVEKPHRLRPNLPKFGVFQHHNFSNKSFPVKKVFILNTNNIDDRFTCVEMNKLAAFNALQQNTYRRMQVDMMRVRQPHFELISRLTIQASIAEVKRPTGSEDIPSFISFIKQQFDDAGR